MAPTSTQDNQEIAILHGGTSTHDGEGNVILYGGTATHDNMGNVVLTVAASEEGTVIAEDEISLSLVDTSEYATNEDLGELDERVVASESVIEQLSDSISHMVRSGDETSLVKQDENGLFYFDIGSLEQSADATAGSLADLLKAIGDIDYEEGETLLGNLAKMESALTALGLKTEYIGQTTYEAPDGNVEPALVLGETDSDYKLLVTNKRIVFMEGSNEPTYIKDNTLVTKNIEVEDDFRQGRWAWRTRPNGNLGLVWIGGDE